ncbi:MAG TPA: hypothetical protein VKT77_10415 [Chthonomonadaceae bacterium]|nr:hypothetical protein [Chthonomonadaceae bacterium]
MRSQRKHIYGRGAAILALLAACSVMVGGLPDRLLREVRQERLDREMIAAVKRDDLPSAVRALDRGANGDARDDPPVPLRERLLDILRNRRRPRSSAPTAMLIELQFRYVLFDDEGDTITRKVPPDFVEALLKHGAGIDSADRDGHTPLWYALMARKGALARQLIDRGARVTVGRSRGELLFHAIRQSYYVGDATVEKILARGADPNLPYQRVTPLGLAVASGSIATVKELLRRGADPNGLSDEWGEGLRRPMEIVIPENQPEMVRVLRAAGACARRRYMPRR